ncbi:hypothetical protein ACFQMM_06170 [Saliphagus sp. GCM10025308]
MTDRNELSEVIAQCTNCGNVYASHVNPDGTVSPIGQRNGCSCGSSEFTVLEGIAQPLGLRPVPNATTTERFVTSFTWPNC